MIDVLPTDVPSDAQLIDVRERDEFASGHAAGARNIPLSELVDRVSDINTDQPVYLICHSGGRSAQAGQYLEQTFGRGDLYNVVGGTQGWVAAGLPVER